MFIDFKFGSMKAQVRAFLNPVADPLLKLFFKKKTLIGLISKNIFQFFVPLNRKTRPSKGISRKVEKVLKIGKV